MSVDDDESADALLALRLKGRAKLCKDLREGLWPTTTLVRTAFGEGGGDAFMRALSQARRDMLARQADAIEKKSRAMRDGIIPKKKKARRVGL